jgi:multimeric flavodoxin WrbA/nitrite reductase/ring-hydroxylating ferredoxin subunit
MPHDERGWTDVGSAEELARRSLQEVHIGRTPIALSCVGGTFGAVSGVCNHAGGPLGLGKLDGEYVVCPWHNWKFHRVDGCGEPGFEEDRVPAHDVVVDAGRVLVNNVPRTRRNKKPHEPHRLLQLKRRGEAGGPASDAPIRVFGLSTTSMDDANPRYSTSDAMLEVAMAHAAQIGAETRTLHLHRLSFRSCEGYYSKAARACTWPCSITQMDASDGLDAVYEALVYWADVMVLATPIRWGGASSLYYKMIERFNCIQNQITIANRVLLQNKVASFIITGGQDNVQGVAGQMLTFFAELGCVFPQFPFVGHSRGWSAEDMERNVEYVQNSEELRDGVRQLVDRGVEMARTLIQQGPTHERLARGGRKAHQLDVKAQI